MERHGDIAVRIRQRLAVERVDVAVVLGSGWGPLVDSWPIPLARCGYDDVGLRRPAAPGHAGELSLVESRGSRILVLSGRTHLYEGHGPRSVAEGIRAAAELGAHTVVLTNANGSLVRGWPLGRIVAISDHLNLTGTSPIVGARFVDMTDAYDPALREAFANAAERDGVDIETGVYAMLPGPHFETAAEAHAVRALGAHVLGMSTALEAIVARAEGMRVLALSTITAHEASGEQIDPDEIVRVAERSAEAVGPALLTTIVGACTAHPDSKPGGRGI